MRERFLDFLLGAGAALLVPIAQALINVDAGVLDNPKPWLVGLTVGCSVALGMYLRRVATNAAGDLIKQMAPRLAASTADERAAVIDYVHSLMVRDAGDDVGPRTGDGPSPGSYGLDVAVNSAQRTELSDYIARTIDGPRQ